MIGADRRSQPDNDGRAAPVRVLHGGLLLAEDRESCETRVDFMAVTAAEKPDFRTIALFRKTHLKALGELFAQVLRLCQKADLVKLGHVALDGSKFRANASKHKAMSYSRMCKVEPELACPS